MELNDLFFKVLARIILLESTVGNKRALEIVCEEFPGLNVENFQYWRKRMRETRRKSKAKGRRKWNVKKNIF